MADAPEGGHDPSRVWLPELVVRFACYLPPNEVACALRFVNKLPAEALKAPEHLQVRLSQPVPLLALALRWANAQALRTLNWEQRRQLLALVARSGVLANLEALLALEDYLPLKPDILEAAAGAGQLDTVQMLCKRGCPCTDEVFNAAAKGGSQSTCLWLLENVCCRRDQMPCKAARGGHVELMDWLLEEATPEELHMADILAGAAYGCDLATMQRLHDKYIERGEECIVFSYEWNFTILPAVLASPAPDWEAKAAWVEARSRLRAEGDEEEEEEEEEVENDAPWALRLASKALAEMFSREDWHARLEWGRRRWGDGSVAELTAQAIGAGNAAAVRSLQPPEPPPDHTQHLQIAFMLGGSRGLLLRSEICLQMLELLTSLGCPFGWVELDAALATGNLVAAAWILERLGQPLESAPAGPFSVGASSGKMEVLEWLLARGCPWDVRVFWFAAAAGSVEQLEWLAARGCPMGYDGAPYARPAARDDVAVLRCLRRLRCPWGYAMTRAICAFKVENDVSGRGWQRPVGLVWLLEQGCPVSLAQLEDYIDAEVMASLKRVKRPLTLDLVAQHTSYVVGELAAWLPTVLALGCGFVFGRVVAQLGRMAWATW